MYFRLKRQEKEYNRYVEHLKLTTDGEKFVLYHILSRDWGRDIILLNIEMIRYNHPQCSGLVWIKCRTRNGSYDFSVGHIGSDGWITDNLDEQKLYISGELYRKMI